jgi:hypothetical protein
MERRSAMEQFCLKVFQLESIPHQFMDMLMKANSNSMLPVPGRSPADRINRCNLGKEGLEELFFGNCTKAHAFFLKDAKQKKRSLEERLYKNWLNIYKLVVEMRDLRHLFNHVK